MKYVQLRKSDYDKSVKLNGQICLCYSAKKLKKIKDDDIEILGEVIKGESKKEEIAKLSVEEKLIPVYEEGTFSKLIYKKSKYIAVENSDGYVVVLENRLPILLWILGLLLITIVAIMLLLNKPEPEKDVVDPYNALPPVDSNIQLVDDQPTTEQTTVPEGGGKVGIGYKSTANLNLSTKEIKMEYTNAAVSNHDALVELYVESEGKEYLIATSGRLPVGSMISVMTLSDEAPKLSEGVYNALYRVHYYDAKTGEKSLVSSDIKDIDLIVRNK